MRDRAENFMTTALVDFHCHLDLFPDLASAIADADAARIYTLTVTTTPKAWPRNHELTRATKNVRAGLGLHPQLVAERSAEIQLWDEFLPEARYVGEVGLDAGPRHFRSFDLQKEVFTHILCKCAEVGGKILSVHSVRSANTVLDLIESHLPHERGRVVLHWFTGSASDARRAIDLGCYFSVNPAMLRNDRGRKLIGALPADRLLTETDAPFTQINDRPSAPTDVKTVVEELAALRREASESTRQRIIANLRTLVGAPEGSD
jgi:TatD DNase family protein